MSHFFNGKNSQKKLMLLEDKLVLALTSIHR